MPTKLLRSFTFFLERWIQKGVPYQLALMAGLIVLVSVLGGLVAHAATTRFEHVPEAVWWAFLRLTDPGYLGDDEGAVLRTVSTVVTVLGYVIFMGSMIAILTQGLARKIRTLESGLTPITMAEHVVILGWTNRTPQVVVKLLGAGGRLERFLAYREARRLRVVVLSDEVSAERRLELRESAGALWNDSLIFLRSGSSLQPEHLERLDLLRASVVIVPGADFELGGAELTDTRVVKTLLTIGCLFRDVPPEDRPQVVAEVFDPLKVPIAHTALGAELEVIASDRILSRLMSQSVRHSGLARILLGLLTHGERDTLYVRGFPELAGGRVRRLAPLFPNAVVLGVLRGAGGSRETVLNPADELELRAEDQLVLLARNYACCEPDLAREPLPEAAIPPAPPPRDRGRVHRVLVLGWSQKVGTLVAELEAARGARFEVTVMSRVAAAERERALAHFVPPADGPDAARRVRIAHVEGNYAIETDLAALAPETFDDVVFVASAWMDSSEEADARTVLGYVLLKAHLATAATPPEILVELLDPDNSHLFVDSQDVVLVSPRALSHLLAHVALRPELNSVVDTLFGAGGTEVELRATSDLGLAGERATFLDVQAAAAARGLTALGLVQGSGPSARATINPERELSWSLAPEDRVVVLATSSD